LVFIGETGSGTTLNDALTGLPAAVLGRSKRVRCPARCSSAASMSSRPATTSSSRSSSAAIADMSISPGVGIGS
jgi:hypothetical protein